VTGGENPALFGGVAGYVLAGGGSTRFGFDKARAELGGKTMLAHLCGLLSEFCGSVSVVSPTGRYEELGTRLIGVTLIEDRWPGEGPLGGIITGLQISLDPHSRADWNLIVGCDMPFLTRDWLTYLMQRALSSGAEVIVPHSSSGLEPLCACWRTSAVDKLQHAFDEGVRKVTEAMKRLATEILDETSWKRFDSAGRLFWNMNTPADYEEARRILEAERA
jgi:molybdopterin-guanine dinucleotide biosynthesis protein A